MTLNQQALTDVQNQRKNPRPKIFDAAQQQEIEITEALEAWIILLRPEARASMVQTLRATLEDDNIGMSERSQLASEFLEDDLRDAQRYAGMVANLEAPDTVGIGAIMPQVGDADSINSVMQDIMLPVGDIERMQDNTLFWLAMVNEVTRQQDSSALGVFRTNSTRRKQVESLIDVLLAY